MPVPTLVTDLSTTLASNSPAGSDNVFPDLDNYLRAMSGFIASIRDNSGNGWVSPYLPLTYSAGTANGVVYLNGSKVVTTGSALVFDGTNLGIGTSSPGAKLNVVGDATFQAASAPNNFVFRGAASSPMNMVLQADQGSGTAYWITAKTNSTLHIGGNGGSEPATGALVIDSSGNLGLGVTPGYAYAGWRLLQCSRDVTFGGVAGGPVYGFMAVNAYPDITTDPTTATWGYRLTGSLASRYDQIAGTHRWFTAPSGTAGNAISFTQSMTLDADGELGIGTTSPSAGLDVRKQETSAYNTARFSNGTDIQFLDVVCGRALTNGTVGGVSSSLVMTLRSSGSSSGHLAFATGNDERARVTQGGDFLVGTSTLVGVGGITLQSITSGFAIVNNNNAAATGYVFESFRRSSTEIGSITQNGTTAVLFNTTSDRRLKDNIAPAPSASDVIDAIEIVSHNWKAAPDEHVTYGVIAQDLALVAPQAVLQGDDGDEIEKTWGVDYSKLVPMLIKEIQSLRARVAALEQA